LVDGTQNMVVDVQPTAPLGPFMDAFCVLHQGPGAVVQGLKVEGRPPLEVPVLDDTTPQSVNWSVQNVRIPC
jgi:hypothetical protein